MPMFRKKPVVIEAIQWSPGTEMPDGWPSAEFGLPPDETGDPCLIIPTLEGSMTAQPNDWIIKGVKNEFYPCKPDIFAMTYEPADD